MVTIKRHHSIDPDFAGLVRLLDQYLMQIDGEETAFYSQFNTIKKLQHCIVLYENGVAVGCGAIKNYDASSYEIKRMFIHPNVRGKGYAVQIVQELERWAHELGATRTLLETGKRMPDAIALYKKLGYTIIDNYDPYKGVANSCCFAKVIS